MYSPNTLSLPQETPYTHAVLHDWHTDGELPVVITDPGILVRLGVTNGVAVVALHDERPLCQVRD